MQSAQTAATMTRPISKMPAWPQALRTSVARRGQPAPASEIVGLIAAAGPLGLSDLAGGICRPVEAVARRLRAMTARGLLLEDEWGRYRLGPSVAGVCG